MHVNVEQNVSVGTPENAAITLKELVTFVSCRRFCIEHPAVPRLTSTTIRLLTVGRHRHETPNGSKAAGATRKALSNDTFPLCNLSS